MLLWSLVPSEWDQALKIFHWADRHGGLRVGVWGWRSPVFKPFGRNYPAFQSISWRLDRVVALASTFLFLFFPYVLMHLYSIYRKVERWMNHIHHAQSGSTCFNHEPCRDICVGWQGGGWWLKRHASHGAWDRVAQSHGLCSLGHISGVQWPTGRWKRQDSRAHWGHNLGGLMGLMVGGVGVGSCDTWVRNGLWA